MKIASEQQEKLQQAKDRCKYRLQGADPHGAYPTGIVRSSYWKFYSEEEELPVYDTPVTHGGPQSFVVIPWGSRDFTAESLVPVWDAEILPENLHIAATVENHKIHFADTESANLMIEINKGYQHPLAIFRAEFKNIDNPEDPEVLYFEPGIHKIRTLELQSGQTVVLAPGAILTPIQPDETDEILVENDWAGKTNYQDLISANKKKNIRICGAGIIDLTALDWHARRSMVFCDCENIEIEDVIFIGAAHWTLPFFGCRNVHVNRARLLAYRENSDGIDLVDTQNALIENCFLRTGDDAICLKSMALTKQVETHDITVRKCIVWNDKVRAFGVAGESRHDIYNAIFEDCDVLHSMADWTTEVGALAVYICDAAKVHHIVFRNIRVRQESNYAICCVITRDKWSSDERAGQVEDILFEDIKMDGVLTPFVVNSYYWCCDPDGHSTYVSTKEPLPVDERTPRIKELAFRNIEAHNCHVAGTFIYGLPEAKIEKVTMENIEIDFAENPTPEYPAMMAEVEPCTNRGVFINNVKELTLKNVKVHGTAGEPFEIENVDCVEKE